MEFDAVNWLLTDFKFDGKSIYEIIYALNLTI